MSNLNFSAKIQQVSRERESNIVLALDLPFENLANRDKLFLKATKILEDVQPYICAVKINRHLILPLDPDKIKELVEKVHDYDIPAIMDCKINDIGSTNQVIAQYYYSMGFDCLTANPFIGWSDGLEPVFKIAENLQRGVILLVYMSHKGAEEGYGQKIVDVETGVKTLQYMVFARKALKWNADGAVVGATYPEKIREIYMILKGKIPIFSPGIGVQGGKIKDALNAGAKYLIVGRAITLSEKPAETAEKIKNLAKT